MGVASEGAQDTKRTKRTDFSNVSSKAREMRAMKKAKEYYWDYNTVESVMLSALIIVCIGGIMFESDRFQQNGCSVANDDVPEDEPPVTGFQAFVRFQRDIVTFM